MKAEANRRKHGVWFEDAVAVFADPLRETRQDRIENGEYRWQTLGLIKGVAVLVVAHTITTTEDDVELIRIISARRATPRERREYENANG